MPTLVTNKQAFFDYDILETVEAGIALSGQEVKSLRKGGGSLKGSYAVFKGSIPFLINASIPAYKHAGKLEDYEPTQARQLLLHKREIERLKGKSAVQGLTLLPLRIYTTRTRIKVELGLGRGKKQHEKRAIIKKREQDREIRRLFTHKPR